MRVDPSVFGLSLTARPRSGSEVGVGTRFVLRHATQAARTAPGGTVLTLAPVASRGDMGWCQIMPGTWF